MAKLEAYSVHDKAAGQFLPPFFVAARGLALRSFMDACFDEKHNFGRYAADYTLYYVGEFDGTSGLFAAVEPQRILSATEVRNKEGGQ